MTHEEEATRGQDARQLLENPIYQSAMKAVEEAIINSMRRVPVTDDKAKGELIMSLQLLDQIQKRIKEYIQTGKMAEITLKTESMGAKLRRVAGRMAA